MSEVEIREIIRATVEMTLVNLGLKVKQKEWISFNEATKYIPRARLEKLILAGIIECKVVQNKKRIFRYINVKSLNNYLTKSK